MQVSGNISTLKAIYNISKKNDLPIYLLNSYLIMVAREIPFDCIQYFLWESLKEKGKKDFKNISEKYPTLTSALCGGIAEKYCKKNYGK
ncbi:hypothetical protein PFTANZ_04061 [Plasmodium falciparum Tanzania (2000708)]|uniref:Uncharacterized protein n=1 Tax=Plasmodium falciparum Tanzania (2000708) TaxID=1036725 RepID=A0A024W3F1_PLAFA|nr:hypothetical protein PFTANZ_04061 [Plasmodium falciparum Tanzania (2000708)]